MTSTAFPQRECSKLRFAETNEIIIGYEEAGPEDGEPMILLHGWPDDVRTFDRLLPSLHEQGFRTFAPYLRGYGPTSFTGPDASRSGQLVALAQDLESFANKIGLSRFTVVGHDWGARAAYIAAALWPERLKHCIALSVGWGTNSPDQHLSLRQAQNYWYHWYMCLPRGEQALRERRREITLHLWRQWAPNWNFSAAEFETTAVSFDNPEWADVVLHSYRVRWGEAQEDPRYAELERRLARDATIGVPALVIHGEADACNDPATSEGKDGLFTQLYKRHTLPGVGHFPQRESPAEVARIILDFLSISPATSRP